MAPHDHGIMVCASCGSTTIIHVTHAHTITAGTWTITTAPWEERRRGWAEAITKLATWNVPLDPLPLFGWYQLFQPWPRLRERVRSIAAPVKLRRAQARACHIDRRRWKRRRFLHALRSTA